MDALYITIQGEEPFCMHRAADYLDALADDTLDLAPLLPIDRLKNLSVFE